MTAKYHEYAKHSACSECSKRAIMNEPDGYRCDNCGAEYDEFPGEVYDEPTDVGSTWTDTSSRADDAHQGDEILDESRIGSFFKGIQEDVEERGPERELTDAEKSKKNLANACFVMGVLACLTIVGIPVGILFFVLGVVVSPDLREDVDDGNSD